MGEEFAFSDLQKDALREIMNIGFGRAAAILSDVINLQVVLSIPRIELIPAHEIYSAMGHETRKDSTYFVIEQYFLGELSGASYLFFPEWEGRRLVQVLSGQETPDPGTGDPNEMERESLLEIGNIIMGACVGKISELLENRVTYQPPQCITQPDRGSSATLQFAGSTILLFQTLFSFRQENLTGFLFIATAESSLKRIRHAVDSYIRSVS